MKDTAMTAGSSIAMWLSVWLNWVPVIWGVIISVAAGVVALLAVYNKILEIQLHKQELKKHDITKEDVQ